MSVQTNESAARDLPMDATNIEYRLQQLENERLPRRVAEVEFITAQLQGEVTAVKEIARGIGVKLDAGIEKLTSHSEMEIGKLQSEQTKALSFLRGVMWVFGVSVGFTGFVVLISPVLKKLLAS